MQLLFKELLFVFLAASRVLKQDSRRSAQLQKACIFLRKGIEIGSAQMLLPKESVEFNMILSRSLLDRSAWHARQESGKKNSRF